MKGKVFIFKFTLFTFGFLMLFGIFDCANAIMQNGMSMDGHMGAMADCLPGETCGMDIGEHLQIWQGMTLADIGASFFSIFAVLFFIGFLFIPRIGAFFFPTASQISPYERHHRESALYNYFLLLFARGILQPKIFA